MSIVACKIDLDELFKRDQNIWYCDDCKVFLRMPVKWPSKLCTECHSKLVKVIDKNHMREIMERNDLLSNAEDIAYKAEAVELGIEHYDEAEKLHKKKYISSKLTDRFNREIALQNAWSLARIATALELIDAAMEEQ